MLDAYRDLIDDLIDAPAEIKRRPPAGEALAQPLCREAPERLLSQPQREVGLELAGLEQEPGAEATHIAVGDARPVVERHERSEVRQVGCRLMEQRAGHPQVDQQHPPRSEADEKVLAAPVDLGDALPLELGSHLERIERPHEPRVLDLDPLEGPSLEHRSQPPADGLDLRELRH